MFSILGRGGGNDGGGNDYDDDIKTTTKSTTTMAAGMTMRMCYNGATTLLATAQAAGFVDLDSIREEPTTSNFDVTPSEEEPKEQDIEEEVEQREGHCSHRSGYSSTSSSTFSIPSSSFKFMENLQKKRKSMFRRNQSSSNLVTEKRRTIRRPSLPSIPPTIEEMSSSVGHARSRRPSLHTDWPNQQDHIIPHHHQQHRNSNGSAQMAMMDNRIYNIESDPVYPGKLQILASFKDIDGTLETISFSPGRRIWEAFDEAVRSRGLTSNEVEFFLDKSSTPIPENSEAHFLAGQKIFVRGRGNMKVGRHTRAAHSMDESNDRATRKMSAEAVSRKSSFVNGRFLNRSKNHSGLNGSDDADCRSNDSSLSVRDLQFDEPSCMDIQDDGGTRRAKSITASSRISLLFGPYTKDKAEIIRLLNDMKEDRAVREGREGEPGPLEKDWRHIVTDWQEMSEKDIKQQDAQWEIITTEHRYIKLLKFMSDLREYMEQLQNRHGYLKDIDKSLVFINFPDLYQTNLRNLWHEGIEKNLLYSRLNHTPLDFRQLWEGFKNIREWSREYIQFNFSHDESYAYVQKKTKENELFREFVTWAEGQGNLERQKLCDIFSQPMQRLTRYNLLLKALYKATEKDDDRRLIKEMNDLSEMAAEQLNSEMNNNDLRVQLNIIMKSIEGYECVDQEELERVFGFRATLDLCDYMPNLRQRVHRRMYHRGDIRMSETKKGSKIDVHCIIFTDMLLICRKSQGKKDKWKIYRPPVHIKRLSYQHFNDGSGFFVATFTEFRSSANMLYMYTSGYDETCKWLDRLTMATHEFDGLYQMGHGFDTPNEEYARAIINDPSIVYRDGNNRMMPPGTQYMHRKASSMDSQSVAAHAHLNHMHKNPAALSAEQLDRQPYDQRSNGTNKQKLSVSSYHGNPLSCSKSSVDLYIGLSVENGGDDERPRSRSNSSGPDIEGLKQRSRSPSPARKEGPLNSFSGEDSPATSTPCRDSPTLLITSEDCVDPCPSGRRFEKRYHTSDGIDVLKPKGMAAPGSILKRFSWNVSSAVGGSRRKLESSRRSSQASNAASIDSFGSSTSGISTASSSNHDGSSCETQTLKTHISTISINDSPMEPQSTLSINLDAQPPVVVEEKEEDESSMDACIPPPPELPPPSKTPSPNSSTTRKTKNPERELLKFIMDNHLETSDV